MPWTIRIRAHGLPTAGHERTNSGVPSAAGKVVCSWAVEPGASAPEPAVGEEDAIIPASMPRGARRQGTIVNPEASFAGCLRPTRSGRARAPRETDRHEPRLSATAWAL